MKRIYMECTEQFNEDYSYYYILNVYPMNSNKINYLDREWSNLFDEKRIQSMVMRFLHFNPIEEIRIDKKTDKSLKNILEELIEIHNNTRLRMMGIKNFDD